MHGNRLYRSLGLLLALLIVAVGCGDSSSSPEALTKADYLRKGNAICSRGLQEKERLVADGFRQLQKAGNAYSPETLEQVAVHAVLPAYREIITKLEGLPAPAGESDRVDAMVAKLTDALERSEKHPETLIKTNFFGSASEAAKAYGLEECAVTF